MEGRRPGISKLQSTKRLHAQEPLPAAPQAAAHWRCRHALASRDSCCPVGSAELETSGGGHRPTCQRLDRLPAQLDLPQRVRLCVSHVQAVALRGSRSGSGQAAAGWSPAAGRRAGGRASTCCRLQARRCRARRAGCQRALPIPPETCCLTGGSSRCHAHLGAVRHALRPVECSLLVAAIHQPRGAAANLWRGWGFRGAWAWLVQCKQRLWGAEGSLQHPHTSSRCPLQISPSLPHLLHEPAQEAFPPNRRSKQSDQQCHRQYQRVS